MKKYFNVQLEFDHNEVDQVIQSTIASHGKGFVCAVESNNLTVANTNREFNEVINRSLINVCDGSVVARILGKIHHAKLEPYLGAELFRNYVRMKKYKQYFLGNTTEVLCALRQNLSEIDPAIKNMPFVELPFKSVDEFDYQQIAQVINFYKPDIIWVSLGAPKQEIFMNKLLPYIDSGVMFGVGAVFNFNSGIKNLRRAPLWMLRHHLEWLFRAFQEPKKNIPRYARFLYNLPNMVIHEYTKAV